MSGCDECVDFNTPPTAGRVCADFQRDQLSPELFVPEGEHAQGTHIPSFSERGVERTSEALTESLDSKDTRMQCMLPAPTSFFPCFSSILALGLDVVFDVTFSPVLGLAAFFSRESHELPDLGGKLEEILRLSPLPNCSQVFQSQKRVEYIVQFDKCDGQVQWLVDAGGGKWHCEFGGGFEHDSQAGRPWSFVQRPVDRGAKGESLLPCALSHVFPLPLGGSTCYQKFHAEHRKNKALLTENMLSDGGEMHLLHEGGRGFISLLIAGSALRIGAAAGTAQGEHASLPQMLWDANPSGPGLVSTTAFGGHLVLFRVTTADLQPDKHSVVFSWLPGCSGPQFDQRLGEGDVDCAPAFSALELSSLFADLSEFDRLEFHKQGDEEEQQGTREISFLSHALTECKREGKGDGLLPWVCFPSRGRLLP